MGGQFKKTEILGDTLGQLARRILLKSAVSPLWIAANLSTLTYSLDYMKAESWVFRLRKSIYTPHGCKFHWSRVKVELSRRARLKTNHIQCLLNL